MITFIFAILVGAAIIYYFFFYQSDVAKIPQKPQTNSITTTNNQSDKKNITANNSSEINKSDTKITTPSKEVKKEKVDDKRPKMKIFFGSQTGTAEEFAGILKEEALDKGFNATVVDLEEYEPEELQDESFVVFLVATYGEGESTDNAKEFYNWLMDKDRDDLDLKNTKFGVFGLGNSTYEQYNKMGRNYNERLEKLGAKRILEYGEGDDDDCLEDDYNKWKDSIWEQLEKEFGVLEVTNSNSLNKRKTKVIYEENFKEQEKLKFNKRFNGRRGKSGYDLKNPFFATIKCNRNLHTELSDRTCQHIEIDLGEAAINYQPGDHLGIYPENDREMVAEIIKLLGYQREKRFILRTNNTDNSLLLGPISIEDALVSYCAITSPYSKRCLLQLSQYVNDENEKKWIENVANSTEEYKRYEKDFYSLTDILKKCPSLNLPFEVLIDILPKLDARYYSISSSPLAHPKDIHITVAVVEFKNNLGRLHKGVASTWLRNLKEGDKVPIFVRTSSFRLPKVITTPVVMIGPGTGFAPFRGFIQHLRHLQKEKNINFEDNVLFFGCRHEEHDFIYRDFMELSLQEKTLSSLHLAFSRQTEQKIYVQHKLMSNETASYVWNLLNDKGGYLYVCGDANNMAKDVHNALIEIIKDFGKRSQEEAELFLTNLTSSGRYQKDVWS